MPDIMHRKSRADKLYSESGRGPEIRIAVHARHMGKLVFTTIQVGKGFVCQDRAYFGFGWRVGGWEWESGNPMGCLESTTTQAYVWFVVVL